VICTLHYERANPPSNDNTCFSSSSESPVPLAYGPLEHCARMVTPHKHGRFFLSAFTEPAANWCLLANLVSGVLAGAIDVTFLCVDSTCSSSHRGSPQGCSASTDQSRPARRSFRRCSVSETEINCRASQPGYGPTHTWNISTRTSKS
jgi:hypothetical protein